MANFTCPKVRKAFATRVTRENPCGVPLDPMLPNSRVIFGALTKITLSPDIEEGAKIRVKTASGEYCINDRDRDRLLGLDATIDFCGIPIPAVEMLIDAILVPDPANNGSYIGWGLEESKTAPEADPKMVELWSKNMNSAQCTGAGGGAYVYSLLPKSNYWNLSGDLTFETDNALTLSVKGYVENNPQWYPSAPSDDFPAYVPGGTALSVPTGSPGAVLPPTLDADPWVVSHQALIQGGGPFWQISVASYPAVNDCDYLAVTGS